MFGHFLQKFETFHPMAAPIKNELGIFLVVGFLTVVIDFISYCGLMYSMPSGLENINIPKGFGFISGTIFAYFANRFWTFNQKTIRSGSAYRFAIVYILSLGANISVNHLSIAWLSGRNITVDVTLFIAFILATTISAVLNFIGMKFFVFTNFSIDKS